MFRTSVLLILLIDCCLSAPVDGPIQIELPIYDNPQDSSNVQLSQPLEPENYPGGDAIRNQGAGNYISNKIQTASNFIGDTIQSKANALNFGGPFAPPPPTLESALQESEGYGSKTLSVKENIQGLVAGIFQPKPIVDTISESEKYGNTGDKFYGAGQVLVGGAQGVSNIVNSVLDIPGTILRKISRVATEKLNNLGGKLVGL
ncbi:hypothetical protein O3G_MSEX015050 [Manduca sexta]|uniref:Uncharacterized protein n=2 Tax=Manduca sexta TaxID=7130 RepID=A0A921ZVX1_MANSE|nr:hypothetical protein O3G_MSEX015050 [Manduca sexta]